MTVMEQEGIFVFEFCFLWFTNRMSHVISIHNKYLIFLQRLNLFLFLILNVETVLNCNHIIYQVWNFFPQLTAPTKIFS